MAGGSQRLFKLPYLLSLCTPCWLSWSATHLNIDQAPGRTAWGPWPSGLFQSFIDGHRAKLPISQQHMDRGAVAQSACVCIGGGTVWDPLCTANCACLFHGIFIVFLVCFCFPPCEKSLVNI